MAVIDTQLTAEPPPAAVVGRRRRFNQFVSIAAFVYLTSTILVMASERAYWYWTGINLEAVFFIGAFYTIPTMAGLWTLAHTPARRLHQVALAAAAFAIAVEGVLTPIIYIDGPLPVMAFMFMGWHGIVAFLGFWYLGRQLLVERRRIALALVSAGFGVFWGVWALASSLIPPDGADEVGEEFERIILDPGGFAKYAFAVGVVLAVSHWLLGFVWPDGWTPGKWSTRLVWLLSAAYMSIAVLPAIFWAPAKLAAMAGGTWWLLKRSRSNVAVAEPTVLQRLVGRVSLPSVMPILLMPAAAASVYGAGWRLHLSEEALLVVYWTLVMVQIVAGGVAYAWAARWATRKVEGVSSLPAPPSQAVPT